MISFLGYLSKTGQNYIAFRFWMYNYGRYCASKASLRSMTVFCNQTVMLRIDGAERNYLLSISLFYQCYWYVNYHDRPKLQN